MKLLLEAPLNKLSLGNVSYNIIRELHKKDVELGIFPTGDIDMSSYGASKELIAYIENAINNRLDFLKPEIPNLKIWHINGADSRKNKDQYLYTFYECNQPTETETKICAAQDRVFFSSNYATDHFKKAGLENVEHIPLGLDEDFKVQENLI